MNTADDLDTIDWKILKELQKAGRITNVELSDRVGLSPPPTLRRVQALERDGFITGYRAQLDGAKLGYGVQMMVLVGLKSQADQESGGRRVSADRFEPQAGDCAGAGADRAGGRVLHQAEALPQCGLLLRTDLPGDGLPH